MLIAIATFVQSGLLAHYFPAPSGKNAFEDYVRAAEVVAAPGFEPFRTWQSALGAFIDVPSVRAARPRLTRPADMTPEEFRKQQGAQQREADAAALRLLRSQKNEFLSVCKDEVGRFGMALDLIRVGNAKPPRFPSDAKELGPYVSNLTNLAIHAAHVKFSEGKSNQAVSYLLDQMWFLDNVERFDSVGSASLSGNAAALTMLAKRLDGLSLSDCRDVSGFVARLLKRPAAGKDLYAMRRGLWEEAVKSYVSKAVDPSGKIPSATEDPVESAIFTRLRSMAPQVREQATNDALALVLRSVADASRSLDGPENRWILLRRDEARLPSSNEDLPLALARAAQPSAFTTLRYDVLFRTRLRILDLSAQARAFRFLNGRLPSGLAELGAEIAPDPLSGQSFVYKVQDGNPKIWSLGTSETGPVYLDTSDKSSTPETTTRKGP